MRRTGTALAAAGALLAVAALPAGADDLPAPTAIGGTPLTVWVGPQGQLQAKRDVDTADIFFAPSDPLGDAGFFLAFPDVPASVAPAPVAPAQQTAIKGEVFGFDGSAGPYVDREYVPVSQGPVTGTGAPTNPYAQVTAYAVDNDDDDDDTTPDVRKALITQTTTYVAGAQVFDVKWDVQNLSGTALRFKAISAADFYFEGSDRGTGIFTQGPPRFIGGTNADTGRSGGFVEVAAPGGPLPWSAYQALEWGSGASQVWGRLEAAGDSAAPSYDDSVVGEPVDNAGAVEWDQYLAPGQTLANNAHATFELLVRTALPAALQFDQTNAGAPQGVPITFTVTAKDTADTPFAGKSLVSTITGANPGTQTAVIGPAGTAAVTDPGTNAGADTVISYIDLNGDGTREPNEPQGSALATFVDHTPPSCTVKVTGDRPTGGGGAGKPLVITVSCDSPATVTTASSLTIQPPTPATPKPKAKAKKKAHKSASASAAKSKKKSKKPAKPKKPKPVVVRLPGATSVVQPGQALPVNLAIPASVIKKYPGATATATVSVTATDTAGNVATTSATKKVTIAKPKAKHKAKSKHKAKKGKKR